MTTDDFTTAAREEAERIWPGVGRGQSRAELDRAMRGGFQVGAEWAREQEPTDAEVMKAARALVEAMEDIEEWDSLSAFQHAAYVHLARRALSAARAVGRDAR